MVHKIMENNPDTLYRYGFRNYDRAVHRTNLKATDITVKISYLKRDLLSTWDDLK